MASVRVRVRKDPNWQILVGGGSPYPIAVPPPGVDPDPTPDTFIVGTTKPTASNTGAGTGGYTYPTVVINGDVNLTTPGQIIENRIINGMVFAKAANTIARNCVIRGQTSGQNLANGNTASNTGFRVEHCTLAPTNPSTSFQSIGARNYTAYRCNMYHGIDGASAIAPTSGAAANVLLQGCYVHDLTFFNPDPNHTDGSHCDCLQAQGGTNIVIDGSNFQAFYSKTTGTLNFTQPRATSAVMMNTNIGHSFITIKNSWLDGGVRTVNAIGAKGGSLTLTGNRFGTNTAKAGTKIYSVVVNTAVALTHSGNVYEGTSTPVQIWRGTSNDVTTYTLAG